jgi:hypothetical protein
MVLFFVHWFDDWFVSLSCLDWLVSVPCYWRIMSIVSPPNAFSFVSFFIHNSTNATSVMTQKTLRLRITRILCNILDTLNNYNALKVPFGQIGSA